MGHTHKKLSLLILLISVSLFSIPQAQAIIGDTCVFEGDPGIEGYDSFCIKIPELIQSLNLCRGMGSEDSLIEDPGIRINGRCFLFTENIVDTDSGEFGSVHGLANGNAVRRDCSSLSSYALLDPDTYQTICLDEYQESLVATYIRLGEVPTDVSLVALGPLPDKYLCRWDGSSCVPDLENVNCRSGYGPSTEACAGFNQTNCGSEPLVCLANTGTFGCKWENSSCTLDSNAELCVTGFYSSEGACNLLTNRQSCNSASFACRASATGTGSRGTNNGLLGLAPAVYNLYNWALGVGALLALAIIIYGGVLYSASAGNPSRIEEAKKWITSALFGLALLFSTVIILNVINPRLTTLQDIETTINPEIKVGFSIIGGGGGVPEQIYEPLDRLPSCKEECEAAIEGGEAVFSCDGLPLCRDALPPDCTSTYCLLTSFSKYAKSLTTRQEIPGVQSPTSPAHVKYVNTLPFGTKSKGHCYGAECGVYVATVIRNTIDPDFPTYGTWNIWPYLEGNDKYEKVEIKSSADLRTGDILMPSDYRSVHETGNLEVTDEDHGHIALWIEGDTYEAALGSEPDLCGTGYLPRGPRSGTKGSSWSSIMDTAFRYKYFNRSNTPGGPNPFIPG
ncbi:MAG: pilin [Candidatus Binatia bacterium]|nr:pilin [Candidatus Binatia bacterium]